MQVRIRELDGKIGTHIVDQVSASLVYLKKEGKFFERYPKTLMIYMKINLVPNDCAGCLTLISLV